MELSAQMIDKRLSTKIEQYVKEGILNVREMKRLLKIYVINDIFGKENIPAPNNRRFFPRYRIIRSHMVKIRKKLR